MLHHLRRERLSGGARPICREHEAACLIQDKITPDISRVSDFFGNIFAVNVSEKVGFIQE